MLIRTFVLICFLTILAWSKGNSFAADGDLNACGCRQDSAGTCYCDRKSKCGCPGECEPKGCEESRAKRLNKEIELETKKAEAQTRRQRARDSEDRTQRNVRSSVSSASSEQSASAARMNFGQKQQLARLLELYVADNPSAGDEKVDQVRADLKTIDKRRPR